MFKKAYVEIGNICNLSCSFCPGTKRKPAFMSVESFKIIAQRLVGHTKFLYFHVMGEPLLHPQLGELLEAAGALGFRVVITTNGTLLKAAGGTLLSSGALHRVNISLQSFEDGGEEERERYVSVCSGFARRAAEKNVFTSFRLWNGGGDGGKNAEIIALLHREFPAQWKDGGRNLCLADRIFLEHGERFDWPDMGAEDTGESRFCHGLRDQIGVLCDGTAVPCCLDHDGDIPLGNLLQSGLDDILAGERAKAVYDGFSARRAAEPLCRRCGYAKRFD